MGFYTEFFICSRINESCPIEVINILDYIFNKSDEIPEPIKPEHDFFNCERWLKIGRRSHCLLKEDD